MNIYQNFADELLSRGLSKSTIPGYVHELAELIWHYQRLPEEIEGTELRQYLIHLAAPLVALPALREISGFSTSPEYFAACRSSMKPFRNAQTVRALASSLIVHARFIIVELYQELSAFSTIGTPIVR